jgi:hypothetical protein
MLIGAMNPGGSNMPTNKSDKPQQSKNQPGRSSSDTGRSSAQNLSDQGQKSKSRELEDDFELANRAGSGTGSQSGSNNTNRR